MFGKLLILYLKVIFLGDFSIVKIFLMKLSRYHDNYFKYFMFGKYNVVFSGRRGMLHVFSSGLIKQSTPETLLIVHELC